MHYRQDSNLRRQKLIRPSHGKSLLPDAPVIKEIKGLAALRLALQQAIALEHFTIPPYLCALYSLEGGKMGPNQEAFKIILSVAMEEMLHMVLAINILNAIGGKPRICAKEFLPKYPQPMPHSAIGFQVNLLKFSKESVNTFLQIERPAERPESSSPGKFWSIGEFYAAVRKALHDLDGEAIKQKQKNGIFTGEKQFQVKEEHYYGGGGKLFPVYSIKDANRAIDEIVGQGEGIDGTIDDGDDTLFDQGVELAHYFRFNEIFHERRYRSGDKPSAPPSGAALKVDWNAVYNMAPNPTMDMFKKHSEVFEKMKDFNRTYTTLLRNIEEACTGKPEVLKQGISLMHELANQAPQLMNMPIDDCDCTAGPSFEYVP